jgi:FAD/FMN-containing dehydrogenase
MTDALHARLAAVVGAANVSDDAARRALAGADLFDWPDCVAPSLVVRPGSALEIAAALSIVAEARSAVVPRGAGLSYTAGAVPHAPAIVFDTTRLAAIEIVAGDLFARVGAGATWEAVAGAAARHGLRVAAPAPISGSHTTIGGAASQNLPGGMDGFIGLEIALADGTLARTGAAARAGGSAFWRHHGPDLTGLFLGDCGAFGIKTEIALRLVPDKPAAFASFGFETATALLEALVALMRAAVVTRGFAMDRLRARAATKVEAGDAARTIGAVVARAGSVGQAMRDVAQLAKAGIGGGGDASPWALHLTAEADTPRAAEERLDAARRICAAGHEIDNVIPKTLRAKPFSIRGMVGPEGERWVPVHGIVPLSRAVGAMAALEHAIALEQATLDAAGMSVNWVVSSMGAYVTIEPMFYWRDALDPIHLDAMTEKNRARFGAFAVNPEGRALARRLRLVLRDVLDAHDAVHAQIGRFYRFSEQMDSGSAALVRRLKAALDPEGRMNPGVLGL